MFVAARFIGFVAAHLDLRAVIRRGLAIDNALRIRRAAPAFRAIRSHPHAAIFRKQRKIRRGSERLAAKIESQTGCQHVIPVVEKILHHLEETGIAREELHFVESHHFKTAASDRFLRAQDHPHLFRIVDGNLFGRILIAFPALDATEAAARVGQRLEHRDFLVAVFPQRIDFGEQMARLARCHIADEQPKKPPSSQSLSPY